MSYGSKSFGMGFPESVPGKEWRQTMVLLNERGRQVDGIASENSLNIIELTTVLFAADFSRQTDSKFLHCNYTIN